MITTKTLKNAARAIECDLWTDPATKANYLVKDGAILRRWEPVDSSGDALDMAVRLHMTIIMLTGECEVLFDISGQDASVVQDDGEEGELHDDEITRLAIVRAAAQVGESLCQ